MLNWAWFYPRETPFESWDFLLQLPEPIQRPNKTNNSYRPNRMEEESSCYSSSYSSFLKTDTGSRSNDDSASSNNTNRTEDVSDRTNTQMNQNTPKLLTLGNGKEPAQSVSVAKTRAPMARISVLNSRRNLPIPDVREEHRWYFENGSQSAEANWAGKQEHFADVLMNSGNLHDCSLWWSTISCSSSIWKWSWRDCQKPLLWRRNVYRAAAAAVVEICWKILLPHPK